MDCSVSVGGKLLLVGIIYLFVIASVIVDMIMTSRTDEVSQFKKQDIYGLGAAVLFCFSVALGVNINDAVFSNSSFYQSTYSSSYGGGFMDKWFSLNKVGLATHRALGYWVLCVMTLAYGIVMMIVAANIYEQKTKGGQNDPCDKYSGAVYILSSTSVFILFSFLGLLWLTFALFNASA